MDRSVVSVIVLVVLVGIGFAARYSGRSGDSSEVLDQAQEIVRACPLYEANKDYMDYLCRAAHKEAFSRAYTPGGRRRQATLDVDKYIQVWFDSMVEFPRADGSTHISEAMAKMKYEYYSEADQRPRRRRAA